MLRHATLRCAAVRCVMTAPGQAIASKTWPWSWLSPDFSKRLESRVVPEARGLTKKAISKYRARELQMEAFRVL